MKKRVAILLSIIMTFVILSGCSLNKAATSNKNIKILLSIADGSDDYRKLIVSNAKEYAKSQNIDMTVKDAEGSIENQVEHMKEAVSGGYNVIICTPVNPSTTLELERASKGIPIVFMNSKPEDKLLEKGKYIYVASNEEVAGRIQAEYIINHFNNKNDIKVVLLKGEKAHNATKGRSDAVKQTFKDNGINVEYVFEDNADWSRQKAKDMFNVFLATGKKFDCVIANNDSMALGVVDSLIENHIDPSSVPILGVDATSDALKAVKNGTIGVTVYQSAKGQSISAVKAAIKMGSGDDLSHIENITSDGKFIWVPFEKVDKSNVDKYIN